MNITKEIVQVCNTNYISIEELVYLYTLYIEENWDLNIYPASIYKLQRLNFISSEGVLSSTGENLLSQLSLPTKSPSEVSRFEEFWLAFPKDDEHHTFNKTRAIRTNKAVAQLEYDRVISDKKATQEQLIEAVTNEVTYRKSFRMENYLKYMKSPTNWLRDSVYLDKYELEDTVKDQEEYGKSIV
jgi:hypothetical protein